MNTSTPSLAGLLRKLDSGVPLTENEHRSLEQHTADCCARRIAELTGLPLLSSTSFHNYITQLLAARAAGGAQ
jgi:hypothetical protein